jgi:cytochrome c556
MNHWVNQWKKDSHTKELTMSLSKQLSLRALAGALALAATLAIASTSVDAQTPPAAGAAPAGPTPAERAIEYRQSVFKIVGGNFGPLSQVAQGKAEFKAETAAKQASRLAQIATFIGDAHPDISKEGKTRALPAIWSNRKEFDQILQDFTAHTKALAEVTENSSSAGEEFKGAVAAVGNDCKSCHEKFRAK